MSSLVRKSSHFTPKVKRSVARPKPVLTPPPTQGEEPVAEPEEDDYGDNDIFKSGAVAPERASRRLSGISLRRNSVEDDLVTIGIPVAKPKKRRASVRKRDISEEPAEAKRQKEHPAPGKDLVVGVDPQSNKLRVFKTSESVEHDLPVAPPGLDTNILSIRQIPRFIEKDHEKFFALVAVLPDNVTMAELCKPTVAIGSVSEKYEMAREARAKISQRRAHRRQAREVARMERISYEEALRKLHFHDVEPEKEDILKNLDEEPQPLRSVQVTLAGGKFVVNQESTVVSRTPHFSSDRPVEVENPFENPITSISYTKVAHTDAWTKEELVQFYNALSTWGTDFTFIAQLFPYRTRRQIKRKYIIEEKNNPELVELALKRKLPADFGAFCSAVSPSSNFKSLEEFHEEMRQLKQEHDRHIDEITKERERAIKEDLEASRLREIEIRTGSKPMTRAEKMRELRKNETVVGSIDNVKRPDMD